MHKHTMHQQQQQCTKVCDLAYKKTFVSPEIVYMFNPFPPSVPIWHRLAKLSTLILEGIIKKKNSYKRRDYESVDEKSLP